MTPFDLEAIEARAHAATPGPWSETDDTGTVIVCDCTESPTVFAPDADPAVYGGNDRSDFRFIAHARCDIPALLTEVRRLQTENRLLEADRDNLRVRVDGLLRDLDRDAEYWAQFNSG